MNGDFNALTNQDFKDINGNSIKNKLDQNYYNVEILNRM